MRALLASMREQLTVNVAKGHQAGSDYADVFHP